MASLEHIYQQELGRDPDPQGQKYWSGLLNSGKSVDQIRSMIDQSEEGRSFQAKYDAGLPKGGSVKTSQGSYALSRTKEGQGLLNVYDTQGKLTGQRTDAYDALNRVMDSYRTTGADKTPPPRDTLGGSTPKAAAWTPTTREVNPDTDTASGQMNRLLDENSVYLQRAQTRALQTANSRGLLNSSMAAGAGTAAAIDAALPIATHDASTYFQQGRDNQNYQNAAGQFNAGEQNRFGLAEQNYQHNRGLADQAYQHNRGLASLDGEVRANLMDQEARIKTQLTELNHGHNVELENLRNDNLEVMNKDTNAANIYMNGLTAIGQTLANGNLSRAQQDAAVSTIVGNMKAGIEYVTTIKGGTPANPTNAGAVSGTGAIPYYDPATAGTAGNAAPIPAATQAPTKSAAQLRREKRERLARISKKQMARREGR